MRSHLASDSNSQSQASSSNDWQAVRTWFSLTATSPGPWTGLWTDLHTHTDTHTHTHAHVQASFIWTLTVSLWTRRLLKKSEKITPQEMLSLMSLPKRQASWRHWLVLWAAGDTWLWQAAAAAAAADSAFILHLILRSRKMLCFCIRQRSRYDVGFNGLACITSISNCTSSAEQEHPMTWHTINFTFTCYGGKKADWLVSSRTMLLARFYYESTMVLQLTRGRTMLSALTITPDIFSLFCQQ